MAVVRIRLCDVMSATSGTRAEADDTVVVSVPAVGTEEGKSARLTLDVSPKGKRALADMVEKAQAATRAAWAPVLALDASRREATGRRKTDPAEAPVAAAPTPPSHDEQQAQPVQDERGDDGRRHDEAESA